MSEPIGYQTQQLRHRVTRPLHRRETIRAVAEAAFKDKIHDEKQHVSGNENHSRLSDDPHDILETRRK